jgi:hypothetical protein
MLAEANPCQWFPVVSVMFPFQETLAGVKSETASRGPQHRSFGRYMHFAVEGPGQLRLRKEVLGEKLAALPLGGYATCLR